MFICSIQTKKLMKSNFELIAFYANLKTLDELIEAGIDGVIVDWENKGKSNRQNLYNTQVNEHTLMDLKRVREKKVPNLICRINGPNYWSVDEIQKAIDLGANELLIPMVKNVEEVEFVLNQIKGKAKVGVMLETNEALAIVDQLDKMPIHRFFVGLNDLAIQRGSNSIFLPLVDGTLDEVRPKINKKFGVAGLTHPNEGDPIPCMHLIMLMKKYKASFGFLRRSFYKDLLTYSSSEILNELREAFANEDGSFDELRLEEKEMFNQRLI